MLVFLKSDSPYGWTAKTFEDILKTNLKYYDTIVCTHLFRSIDDASVVTELEHAQHGCKYREGEKRGQSLKSQT